MRFPSKGICTCSVGVTVTSMSDRTLVRGKQVSGSVSTISVDKPQVNSRTEGPDLVSQVLLSLYK